MTDSTAWRLPAIARVAAIVTFILVGLALVSAVTSGELVLLITVPIFLAGAIGILRGRVWSAYGLGLFQIAQLFALSMAWLRDGWPAGAGAQPLAIFITTVACAVLYFFAGRALAASGATTGRAVPWIVLAVVFAAPFVFFQPFSIPTGSMEDSLLVGDFLAVQRWPTFMPKRGDIVVHRSPLNPGETYVRRVIGVPGDRIKIAAKQLYLNGAPLQESYVVHKTSYVESYRDNFPSAPTVRVDPAALDMLGHHVVDGEIVVPDGSYFVLGDNRDSAWDSRFFGFVPSADVIGKPVMVYWSKESSGPTRWNRIFKFL